MSIFIKADNTGKVLAWGRAIQGVKYSGVVPADFNSTAGMGKYTFNGTDIVEVDGWTPPPPPEQPPNRGPQ